MRVRYQRYIVVERNRTAARGIDAVFGHAPHNDEMADFAGLKFFCKSCLEERIRCLLSDDRLPADRKNRGMDRPRRALGFDGMSLGTVMLNEQDWHSRGARLAQQNRDIR